MYKKEFGYEALTELIKKYNLAELKYIDGEKCNYESPASKRAWVSRRNRHSAICIALV